MTSNVSTTLRNAAKIAAFRSRVRTSAYHHVVKDIGLRAEDRTVRNQERPPNGSLGRCEALAWPPTVHRAPG